MTHRRQQQLLYLISDILTAEVVWLCFLLFRWLVYEGKVFGWTSVMIPAFDFHTPLIVYPLVCVCIYYLSGYYLRPFQKPLERELWRTMASAVLISLIFFFIIIINDQVTTYQHYLVSLLVLMVLQFVVSYIPRLTITLLSRKRGLVRTQTIHSIDEAKALQRGQVDEVVIDLPEKDAHNESAIYQIINQLYPLNIEIAVKPRLFDMLTGAASIRQLQGQPLVLITSHRMSDCELCIKRACDVLLSAIAIVLLSPIFAVLALLVKFTSPGAAIYRQERIGQYGIPFQILKFRTMYTDAESSRPMLSQDNDPRVTPVGRYLRKYRLDELPQLWNVLIGEMSIVGPRPERQYFIDQIYEKAPYYCLLYKIRPGLTSWGPIRVGYTDTLDKMIDRLNYDIVYMENMSLKLDIKIMLYTLKVIIDGKGK